MRRLTLAEVERRRGTPGQSLLLFITDRCPVGCAHCSVDSRRDSATITDFARFEAIVAGICAQPRLSLVGISGGEPFVERRGLTLAVDRLVAAGKELALYTSGVWATPAVPGWVREVIRPAACVFLSTDAFHAASVAEERFVRAARTIAEEGVWLIVQVLRLPEMVARAERLLRAALGAGYQERAELSLISPLPYGRGAAVFAARERRPGASFGACNSLAAPVVRYDGIVTACCNERVITGHGPERLRRRCASAEELAAGLADLRADPLLGVIGGPGGGALTQHPRFADLAERRFSSICELCWASQQRACTAEDHPDRLLAAMALLGRETREGVETVR
jgi:pyruvate-formate lyase-activating enzyme